MEGNYRTIQCGDHFSSTCRRTPFGVMDYTLNYHSCLEDKELIDSLLEKACLLAREVNPGAANDSVHQRTANEILANCIAGVVSEYFWILYINTENEVVSETDFEGSAGQIDLKVVATGKKIEVRSSFPRNGLEFALCHPVYQFDILGPYSNSYKPDEIQKDYYVRTLFHLAPPTEILRKIKKDNFHVYLTGGATWNMMIDNRYSRNKSLIPEDDLHVEKATLYRVVPFSNALDTHSIKNAILMNR